MRGTIHAIIVLALVGKAPRADGQELRRLPDAAPVRSTADDSRWPPSQQTSDRSLVAPNWFRPLNAAEVFTSTDHGLQPVTTRDTETLELYGHPPRLPPMPALRPIRPERPGVMLAQGEWDRDVVTLAAYPLDNVDAIPAVSLGELPLLAPQQDEPLPPPLPGDTTWGEVLDGEQDDATGDQLVEDRESAGGSDSDDATLITPADGHVQLGTLPLKPRTVLAARLGAWSVDSSGSPVKVGEFQSLDSSVFFDVDGLYTDGVRTWDFYGSLLDKDAPQAGLRLYGPTRSLRFDYQSYLRRLDRDPYRVFVDFNRQPTAPLPGPPANFRDMKEDLTVGQDFAIRVQELKTNFKGRLTDHVSWRLNLWGMRKHGERQASAFAHCFTAPNATDVNGNPVGGVACHVLSQSQRIDWLTAEMEPAVEARYGPVTVEYSRTMRILTTDDQVVTRPYDNLGFNGELPYAITPENHTEIDRLKIGVLFPEGRNGYARLYTGHTENEFRDTDRDFRGYDLRFTDQSVSGVALTGYARRYVQEGTVPNTFLPLENPNNIRAPINYDRTVAGFDVGWRPFYDEVTLRSRLRFNSGYEYRELERENAIFAEQAFVGDNSFTQTNIVYLRTGMRWTPTFESYSRYRVAFIDDPLFAVPIRNTTTNTSLPTQTHGIQLGNTWTPSPRFFLHSMVGLNFDWHSSEIADFEEDRYDLVFTAWYAPTMRWTVSGGLGFFSNWIDQDITLGSKSNPLTLPWEYGGRSDVFNVGTTYAWTDRLTVSSSFDFVRGRNWFDELFPWPDLWTYSDVNVETTRLTFGTDYELTANSSLYFRYQLFDYEDKGELLDSGNAEMYLFGINAFY